MGQLDGKVVIVTGAAQGMGQRHAEQCVAAGARVIATDVQDALGREAVAGLGDAARFVPHDVTDEQAWDRVVDAATQEFGGLDGLVNNAAIYKGTCPIEDEPLSVFESTLRINVIGTWLGIKKAIAPLRARGGGAIVNVSSIAGMKGLPGFGSYGSSKWAVRGLTKVAASELGPTIRVNSVHPGPIDTPMITDMLKNNLGVLQALIADTPLERVGTAEEVASLVLFLASDEASYCTGGEFLVEGGRTAATVAKKSSA